MGCVTAIKKAGVDMDKKCICGSCVELNHMTKLGRINDTLIQVFNVPVYTCNDCGYSYMIGSDSIKFAKKVDEAYYKKIDKISF